MDPIAAVLTLLKPSSCAFRGLDVGGSWALKFPATESIRCYAVTSGRCWIILGNCAETIQLSEGDCFLLTGGQSFVLTSDPNEPVVDMAGLLSTTPEGGVFTYKGGGDVTGIGGFFEFHGPQASALLAQLPPFVHVRNESCKASLIASMDLMTQELREPQAGSSLVAQHLAQMMLVLAIRAALSCASIRGVGWLSAIGDKKMSAAISAIHLNPRESWTLQSLAALANMSRSAFAARFKEIVGTSPMGYLRRWRMMLVVEKLMNSNEPISVIGISIGYGSESAFSTAFKKVMGCSPVHYTRMRSRRA